MKFCTHYTAANFELDERHVIKNESCIGQTLSSIARISCYYYYYLIQSGRPAR